MIVENNRSANFCLKSFCLFRKVVLIIFSVLCFDDLIGREVDHGCQPLEHEEWEEYEYTGEYPPILVDGFYVDMLHRDREEVNVDPIFYGWKCFFYGTEILLIGVVSCEESFQKFVIILSGLFLNIP